MRSPIIKTLYYLPGFLWHLIYTLATVKIRLLSDSPTQTYVENFLATFEEYPPRQKAASFTIGDVMEKLTGGGADWTSRLQIQTLFPKPGM